MKEDFENKITVNDLQNELNENSNQNVKTSFKKAVHHAREISEKLGYEEELHLNETTNKNLHNILAEKIIAFSNEEINLNKDFNKKLSGKIAKSFNNSFAEKTGEDEEEYKEKYLNTYGMSNEDLSYLLSNAVEKIKSYEENLLEEQEDLQEQEMEQKEKEQDKIEAKLFFEEMRANTFEVQNANKPLNSPIPKEDPDAPVHEVRTITSENKEIRINLSKGLKQGPMIIVGPNGSPEMEVEFNKDMLHGASKYYFASGKLERLIEFKNGQMHGVMQVFLEDGKLSMEMHYENGQMHGSSRTYNPEGELHIVSNYNHGQLDGEMVIYSHDKPYLKRIYKNGIQIHQEVNASVIKKI